jgi:hypothetical protein
MIKRRSGGDPGPFIARALQTADPNKMFKEVFFRKIESIFGGGKPHSQKTRGGKQCSKK